MTDEYKLIYPYQNNKIYYYNSYKKAGKKIFKEIYKKKNIDQLRFTIKNLSNNIEHNLLAINSFKLKEYQDLILPKKIYGGGQNENTTRTEFGPATLGEVDMVSPKEFYKKLTKLCDNINISVDEFIQLIKVPKLSNISLKEKILDIKQFEKILK